MALPGAGSEACSKSAGSPVFSLVKMDEGPATSLIMTQLLINKLELMANKSSKETGSTFMKRLKLVTMSTLHTNV